MTRSLTAFNRSTLTRPFGAILVDHMAAPDARCFYQHPPSSRSLNAAALRMGGATPSGRRARGWRLALKLPTSPLLVAIGSHARPFRTSSRRQPAARWEIDSQPCSSVLSVCPHATPICFALCDMAACELQSASPAFSHWRISCRRSISLAPSLIPFYNATGAIPELSIGITVYSGLSSALSSAPRRTKLCGFLSLKWNPSGKCGTRNGSRSNFSAAMVVERAKWGTGDLFLMWCESDPLLSRARMASRYISTSLSE